MFHILLILLFDFLMKLRPETAEKAQEHRIKVALKEKPKSSKKPAAVKNLKKPIEKAPPIPEGKQLEKLPEQTATKTPQQKPPKREVKTKPKSEKKQAREPIVKETPSKKQVYRKAEQTEKKDINITKAPKKKTGLYAMLSKKQKPQKQTKAKPRRGTQIGSDFKEAYGEAFGRLSEGEKRYIIDNQEMMRRITQEQLNRLGPVNIPRNLNVNTMNIIEFYLHPNGDISGLKILNASGYQILDDTSLQTIEYSYHRYPLPEQKTLVRYRVGYYLGGRRH